MRYRDSKKLTLIDDFQIGKQILKSENFAVVDFGNFLMLLNRNFGVDLENLSNLIGNTSFFIEGDKHTQIKRATNKLLNASTVRGWSAFVESEIGDITLALTSKAQVDIIDEYAFQILSRVLGPILGLTPKQPQAFFQNLIKMLEVIEYFPGVNTLKSFEETTTSLYRDIEQQIQQNLTTEHSVLHNMLQETWAGFTQQDKLNVVISLGIGSCVLYLTIINTLGNIYSHNYTDDQETLLNNLDRLLFDNAPTRYVLRQAQEAQTVGQWHVQDNNVVCIKTASHVCDRHESSVQNIPQHLCPFTFGAGRHSCPGMGLSKLIYRHAITRFLDQFPDHQIVELVASDDDRIIQCYSKLVVESPS